jgi:hypothetical protein
MYKDGYIVFSTNGEFFDTEFDCVCDEVEDLREDGEIVSIWVGELDEVNHRDYINAHYIVEQMADAAYDDLDDFTEGYLDDVTMKQLDELEEVISNWFDENVSKPSFFRVRNMREVSFKVGQRDKAWKAIHDG